MKLKKSAFCLLGAVVALSIPALSSCGDNSVSSVAASSSSQASAAASSEEESEYTPDLSKKVTLNMSCYYSGADTAMRYSADNITTISTALGGTIADGSKPNTGDFKPVWKTIQDSDHLNFSINDQTVVKDGGVGNSFTNFQLNGFKGGDGNLLNVLQGNSSQIIAEGTTNGTILNLTDYLDKMPNFKKFLKANPVVEKSIIDSSGAIYYTPYFDGNDDMEKTLIMRKDWVEKLLDGESMPTCDEGNVITSEYTRFNDETVNQTLSVLDDDGKEGNITKNYSSGKDIITIQNALTTKNGKNLVQALRDYIDTTYNKAYGTKRSELFIGGKACYNIDELVALYRCVKTNSLLLSGATQDIFPLMPRESKNTRGMDLHSFMANFGCRGLSSRQTYYYVGDDGKIHDIRLEDNFITACDKMNDLYKEGLILPDFDTTTAGSSSNAKGDFSKGLMLKNRAFSEFDYVQTQTILNTSNKGMELVPVYPAAYDWDGTTESRYTESWRSVKTQGWFITKGTADDADKLSRSLALFDYFFSDEGNTLMSYGPSAWIDGTTTYMGRTIPKLSDACTNELDKLTAGNYTNYYRYFLGGTFPIGYVKEQGMEYQTVDKTARPYLDTIENSLSLGVIAHPKMDSLHHDDHMEDIMPTTLPYTTGEQNQISSEYGTSSSYFYTDTKGTNVISKIIMSGFGSADTTHFTTSAEYLSYIKDTLKLNNYLSLVQKAYTRVDTLADVTA